MTPHVNDGRAFLENTDARYDLILFALPTRSPWSTAPRRSGSSPSFHRGGAEVRPGPPQARRRLPMTTTTARAGYRPPGRHRRPPSGTRRAWTASPPTRPGHRRRPDERPGLRDPSDPTTPVVAPATDDAPFLYYRGVSRRFTLDAGRDPAAVLAAGPRRRWTVPGMRPYADLFFMGVAFPPLETKNVATFALLFGTTWLVNALVFAASARGPRGGGDDREVRTPPLRVVFGGVRPPWCLRGGQAGVPARAPLRCHAWCSRRSLAFLPIFLANIAFAKRFAQTADAQEAFAVNLLGAIVGGCLEYAALLTGYDDLLIVTARDLPARLRAAAPVRACWLGSTAAPLNRAPHVSAPSCPRPWPSGRRRTPRSPARRRARRRRVADPGDASEPVMRKSSTRRAVAVDRLRAYAGAGADHVRGADLGHVALGRPHVGALGERPVHLLGAGAPVLRAIRQNPGHAAISRRSRGATSERR